MADVDLSFGGNFSKLFDSFKQALAGFTDIGVKSKQVANTVSQEFVKVASDVDRLDANLAEAAIAAGTLSSNLQQAAQSGLSFEEQTASAQQLQETLGNIDEMILKIARDAITEGEQFTNASNEKERALQNEIARLKELIALSGKAANPKSVEQFNVAIKESTNRIQTLTSELKKVPASTGIPKAESQVKSIRTQFIQARNEAAQFIEKFGEFSPEALQAASRAARLKEELSDVNERIDALNPEKKFQAVAQLASAIAGGASAIQGGLALIGVEGEEVQKTLLKVQAALALSQGINQLLGFVDAYKNIRAVIVASTTATVANTVATEANAVSQVAATGAITTEAAATTAATTATRSFTAALLANPFTAIAVALVAVTAAVLSFSKAEDEAREKAKELTKELEEQKARLNEIAASQFDKVIESENFFLSSQEQIARETSKTAEERDKKLEELALKRAKFTRDVLLSELRSGIEITAQQRQLLESSTATINQIMDKRFDEREQKEKANQEKTKERLEKYKQELDQLLQELDQKATTQITNNASARDRLEIDRQTSIQEVLNLEKTLLEKGRLINQNFQLTKVQQEQINALLLGIEKKYREDSESLLRQELTSRLDLIKDTQARELAEFDLSFQEKQKILRERGLSDTDIETIRFQERQKINLKFLNTDLDQQEQFFINQAEIQQRNNATFEERETDKQKEILRIQLQFAQIRLQNLVNDGSTEALLAKSNLEKQIKGIQDTLTGLDLKTPKFSLFKLLGLTEDNPGDEAIFKQKLAEIGNAIGSVYTTLISEQEAFVQQRKESNDEYLEQLNNTLAQEEQALQTEIRLSEQGFASNVDAKRREVDAIKAERNRALAEQKKIAEEEKKIAKEKAIVEAAQQGAALITAGANIFAAESPKGVVGVITAIAAVATMIAGFLSLKAKVSAATNLEHGGDVAFGSRRNSGYIRGKRHTEQGGERIGNTNIFAEDGEFMVNRVSTNKYYNLIDAINNDYFADLKMPDIEPLLTGTGVELSKQAVEEVYNMGNVSTVYNSHLIAIDNAGVETRLNNIYSEISENNRLQRQQPKYYTDSDGFAVVETNNTKKVTR